MQIVGLVLANSSEWAVESGLNEKYNVDADNPATTAKPKFLSALLNRTKS
jgi:hypothetical protein